MNVSKNLNKRVQNNFIRFYVINMLIIRSDASVFATISNMEGLLETQRDVLNNLYNLFPYVPEKYKPVVRRFLDKCEQENTKAQLDEASYLGNPINAYKLVKRLSIDLRYIEERVLRSLRGYSRNSSLFYPTVDDCYQADRIIIHLVGVYSMSVSEVANGSLVSYANSPLSSSDCLKLAMTGDDFKEYGISAAFAIEALKRYNESCYDICGYDKEDIVVFLQNIYDSAEQYKQGQHMEKHKITQNTKEKKPVSILHLWDATTKQLCLGHGTRASLYCEYRSGPHPFLHLARIKAEVLHLNPEVTMLHDVISDTEIEAIENIVRPKIINGTSCETCRLAEALTFRHSVLLKGDDYRLAAVISRRSLDISGLDSSLNRRRIKVIDYGVGGYHKKHGDVRYLEPFRDYIYSARATVLYYLGNVIQGGATIFPELNLSVFPVRNAALYWRTLLPSGEVDTKSVHASCPPLFGTKRVISKWISDPDALDKKPGDAFSEQAWKRFKDKLSSDV